MKKIFTERGKNKKKHEKADVIGIKFILKLTFGMRLYHIRCQTREELLK